jgi:chromosome segregation ATPase
MSVLDIPRSRRAKLAAVGVTAALVVGGVAIGSSAWAGSGPAATSSPTAASPSVAKDRVNLTVDRQLAAIDRVSAALAGDANLTAAEKSTATADLTSYRSALADLKNKVDGESTTAAIRADVKAARQAGKANPALAQAALYLRGAEAGARLDAVDARVARIQSRLESAKANGKDVTAARDALSDLQAKVSSARNELKGFGPALLSAQPPSSGVAAATTSLKAVTADMQAIGKDVKTIRQALGKPAGTP